MLNESSLEQRFNQVSNSQASIQSLSFFCLHYKSHHKKIAQIWLRCLQKAKVPHRLTLIYLANDIVQNAKRKNVLSFIEDFRSVLKDTVPYLRDDKIKKSVERVFSIWQDRSIFDSKFTNELKASLNDGAPSQQDTPNKNPIVEKPVAKNHPTNDLNDILDRLSNLERETGEYRHGQDNIIDRMAHGNLFDSDGDRVKTMIQLKSYILLLKSEIEERHKLARTLDDTMDSQRRIVKESEEQLVMYKSQLEYISKLREDLRSPV